MTPFALLLALACAPKPADTPPPEGAAVQPSAALPSAAQPSATAPTAEPAAAPVATVGQPAPAFQLNDLDGKAHTLADYAGKTVVLEWFNPDCPFVKYAHGAGGPLASLPQQFLSKGVVWLAINSGAEGKQGAAPERNREAVVEYGMTYPVLLDGTGQVGRAYAAKTTPHLYIIDPQGTLVYAGALDNAPMGKADAEPRVDHTAAALDSVLAGQPVQVAQTQPYGCSVKY